MSLNGTEREYKLKRNPVVNLTPISIVFHQDNVVSPLLMSVQNRLGAITHAVM
jgi:hypothetical protein